MKKKLGALLRVVVSVGILFYLFHGIFHKEAGEYFETHQINPDTLTWMERARIIWRVGPLSLWEAVQKAQPLWIVAAIVCAGIPGLLGIIRWRWILRVQGLQVRFPRLVSITFIGLFFNAFMLGSTGGDVIKAWYVARETHHKKAESVATVAVDRLIGLLALFIIALGMMGIYYKRVFEDPKLLWFALATVLVVLATVALTVIGLWRGLADRFPRLRAMLKRLPRYDTLRRMVDAYRAYASHPAVLAKTILISFAVHIFSMLSIVCVGRGLGITSAGIIDYFLYLPIINSVTAVPITISGFGVREGMYIKMFGQVGVAQPTALVMSLLGYLCNLFWSLVGAPFYLTHRKELPPPEVMAKEG
jgi:uncharacterized protein (TIRG00374 family)